MGTAEISIPEMDNSFYATVNALFYVYLHLQSGSSKNSGLDVILKFEQELERSIQGIKKE